MTNITIRDISVATDATVPDEYFVQATEIRNAVYAAMAGNDDEWTTPEQYLQGFTGTQTGHRVWLVEADGVPAAMACLDIPLEEGTTSVYAEILVLPAWEGKGIGSQVLELLEAETRAYCRTSIAGWAEHPADPSVEQLKAPTGFGTIPRDRIARFALRHGFALEQVDRKSTFELALMDGAVRERLREAESMSAGYEILQWTGPTPAELQDGMARLRARMSTDAPSAGLDVAEEVWDAARIREHDERTATGGRLRLMTVARHIASGELVAYNVLGRLLVQPDSVTEQGDTLVHADHRGHRLGMLVKCRGLIAWHEEHSPESPRVLTWNAEENRPMLDINEALGFVPAGYIGAWQKSL